MYKEDYIPDGPEGAVKYDPVLGAEYRIENGKRIYISDHDMRPVPDEEKDLKVFVLTILSIIAALIIAVVLTFIYLIIRLTHHV